MIYPLLLLAFLLRIVHLDQGLWLDEAIGAIAARDYSYLKIVTEFLKADNHPPLYYLTLKFWSFLFGYSEISLRFLSVLFGVLTVWLVYLLVKKILANKNLAVISALFLATSPLHVYYSQEVRMYPMIAFLATALVYQFSFLITKKQSVYFWILFSLLIALTLFTDYIMVFLIPVFFIWGLISKKDLGWFIKLFLCLVPFLFLFVFWLPIFLVQVEGGKVVLQVLPSWRNLAGGATLKQTILVWNKFILGRISLDDKKLYYGLLLVSSVPFLVSLFFSGRKYKRASLIWIWLLVPLITGFLASFLIPDFTYFRFIYVLPAFFILIAWGVFQIKNELVRKIMMSFILAVNLVGLSIYYFDTSQLREDWKGAVEFVEGKGTKEDVAVFEFPEPFAGYRWYTQNKVEAKGVTDRIFVEPAKTRVITESTIKDKKGVYYFEYLRDLTDPTRVVEKALEEKGFKKMAVYNFRNIGQISYFQKE